jgi:hypothetical protein
MRKDEEKFKNRMSREEFKREGWGLGLERTCTSLSLVMLEAMRRVWRNLWRWVGRVVMWEVS